MLKNLGEEEDGVYDWMLLNGGRGYEANPVRFSPLPPIGLLHQAVPLTKTRTHLQSGGYERERERGERRHLTPEERAARERRKAEKARQREQAQQLAASTGANNAVGQTSSTMAVNPPSPAMVRKNSNGKNRSSANPNGSRNSNTDAYYGSTSQPPRRSSNQQTAAHPYSQGLDPYGSNDPYRTGGVNATERSLVGNSAALQTPLGTSDRRFSGGGAGRAGDLMNEQEETIAPRSTGQKIIDFLTCRCG